MCTTTNVLELPGLPFFINVHLCFGSAQPSVFKKKKCVLQVPGTPIFRPVYVSVSNISVIKAAKGQLLKIANWTTPVALNLSYVGGACDSVCVKVKSESQNRDKLLLTTSIYQFIMTFAILDLHL